jgi:hypothetical protein
MMKSPWSCHCGRLGRIKFKDCTCLICRTDCRVKPPRDEYVYNQMASRLANDYHEIGLANAIRLTIHTMKLVQLMRETNAKD